MAATWRRKDFGRAWRGPDICRKEKKGNNFITFLFKNLVRCLYKRSHGACYYERLIFIYILFPPRFFSFFLPQLVPCATTGRHRTDGLESFRSFKQINSRKRIRSNDCGGKKKAAPSRNARV